METLARNWLKRFKLRLQSTMITVACPVAYLEPSQNRRWSYFAKMYNGFG